MSALTTSSRFRYRAAREDGRVVRGVEEAVDQKEARRRLNDRGLVVLTLDPDPRVRWARRVRTRDLAIVLRNVAILVASGVPIERALAVSEELVPEPLRGSLVEVRTRIREGQSVAAAMASRADIFPRAIVGIIDAGERGSALDRACEGAASQLEADAVLRSEIRSALAYPLLILAMGIVTVAIMGGVVVPRFAAILGDLGSTLPPSTRMLMGLTDVGRRAAPAALLGALMAGPVAQVALRQESVRRRMDDALLRLPLVGALRLDFATARTCRSMGTMLQAGMPLLPALDAAVVASGDLAIAERLRRSRESVARGRRLADALRHEEALSPLGLQLVALGESSGSLGSMLSRAAALTADQAARRLRTAVAMLEPLLVVLLGAVVALTAGALLQAVYSVRPI